MKRIAVLLAVHNRKQSTLTCLTNLYNQVIQSDCIMCVYMTDDGCTDGTPETVKGQFPQVQIIKGDGDLYWNRGMWTAWNEAAKYEYDYYLWLNDDTFLYTDAIEYLLASAKDTADQSIIVGVTTNAENSVYTYGGRINGKIPVPFGKLIEVQCFNGNVVLVPRYVFDIVGNLDYYFIHSKGDFDYGMRARKAGIKAFQVGKAIGICELHETIDKWCDPNVPFLQRWKSMWKPNGMPPHETLYLEKRHLGICAALFHYFTIYLRCFFPQLWINKMVRHEYR